MNIYHSEPHHDHHFQASEEEIKAYRRQQAAQAQPVKQEAEYISHAYRTKSGERVYVDARQAYPMMLDGFSI